MTAPLASLITRDASLFASVQVLLLWEIVLLGAVGRTRIHRCLGTGTENVAPRLAIDGYFMYETLVFLRPPNHKMMFVVFRAKAVDGEAIVEKI